MDLLHTTARYGNISSKFDFLGAGIEVKVVVAIFRKKNKTKKKKTKKKTKKLFLSF